MHWIQVLLGPLQTLNEAKSQLPSAVVCPLPQGFALIPLTDEVQDELQGLAQPLVQAGARAVLPPSGEIADGVAELACALSNDGYLVYAATFFYGGSGGQDAIVWRNGEVMLNIGDDEDSTSPWPDSPISRALRQVGVKAEAGEDEFDALGLGRYRSNDDWTGAH